MEVVQVPNRRQPTHAIRDINGWRVELYFTPKTMAKLRSRDEVQRAQIQHYVCKRYREACKRRYADWTDHFVRFDQLEIRSLESDWQPPQLRRPRQDYCNCPNEECKACDIGYHSRCQYGCTLGR